MTAGQGLDSIKSEHVQYPNLRSNLSEVIVIKFVGSDNLTLRDE